MRVDLLMVVLTLCNLQAAGGWRLKVQFEIMKKLTGCLEGCGGQTSVGNLLKTGDEDLIRDTEIPRRRASIFCAEDSVQDFGDRLVGGATTNGDKPPLSRFVSMTTQNTVSPRRLF